MEILSMNVVISAIVEDPWVYLVFCCCTSNEEFKPEKEGQMPEASAALLTSLGSGLLFNLKQC